jgi:hypothetical protein
MVVDCRNAKGHVGRRSDQMPKNGSDRRKAKIGITPRNLGNKNCGGHGPNVGCHATAATALLLLVVV